MSRDYTAKERRGLALFGAITLSICCIGLVWSAALFVWVGWYGQMVVRLGATAIVGFYAFRFWRHFLAQNRVVREDRFGLPDRVFRKLGEPPSDL